MRDLFSPITRDERQEESRVKWIKNKCCGTIVAPTGYGKTRTGLLCIKSVLKKYPSFRVIIVVPTQGLQSQWIAILDKEQLSLSCEVIVVNTACSHNYCCDLLVLDEEHRFAASTYANLFKSIKYKLILGLTATFERLDGKHELLNKYCPVIDEIPLEVALVSGWVSQYKEYLVLIDVDDISVYEELNRKFIESFEYFFNDFNLAMSMIGKDGLHNRLAYRDKIYQGSDKEEKSRVLKEVTYHAMNFSKYMQARKTFINNHPKKIEVAEKIINARKEKKIICFSNNIKMAEQIKGAVVYSGRDSKKRSKTTIEDFSKADSGILSTIYKADEGLDIPGLSVGIILGLNSSKTKATQRRGRIIRREEGKQAEIFNIVINDTKEIEWFRKSHEKSSYITIDEANLDKVLRGEEPEEYKKPVARFSYRF